MTRSIGLIETSPANCKPCRRKNDLRNSEIAGRTAWGDQLPFLAHDLNNYLHVVGSHICLAKVQAGDGEIADNLSLAEAGLQLVKVLLDQFLTSSQDEKEILMDMDSLLTAVNMITKLVLHDSGIRWSVEHGHELWPLKFRCNSLLRIFVNLLTNAREAMPGGGEIFISIGNRGMTAEGQTLPGFLTIAISDQGTGIPADILPHIFTPGFSTKKNGRGLGLAFCRNVLDKNGGRLEVASTVGMGTTFTLHLPAIPAG
jgi:two-component system, cell cycle sensor histidine kinase and response regulator CckA